jgi:hypothetical protein
MLDSKPFPDFRDGKKRRESLCIFAKSLETDEALRVFVLEKRFFTLVAQRMRSPKKHGMRSHSPREGQRPRSSCLAAAKGAGF